MSEFSELRQKAGLSVQKAAEAIGCATSTAYSWETGQCRASQHALDVLRGSIPGEGPAPSRFRFIDLFAGIGGLRRGFDALGGRWVFTSEWDRFALCGLMADELRSRARFCGRVGPKLQKMVASRRIQP